MSEAVIARLQEKAGAPKDKILKVDSITPIQSNYTWSISQSKLSGNSLRVCVHHRGSHQGKRILYIWSLKFKHFLYIIDLRLRINLASPLWRESSLADYDRCDWDEEATLTTSLVNFRELRERRTGTITGSKKTPRRGKLWWTSGWKIQVVLVTLRLREER